MGWTREWAAELSSLRGDREASCVWQPLCHREAISGKKLSGEGPWTWGSGCQSRFPRLRARRGGQGSCCPVSAVRAESVWLTVSPALSAAARRHMLSHGRASGPGGAGETDTACDRPPGPRSEVDIARDKAGLGAGCFRFGLRRPQARPPRAELSPVPHKRSRWPGPNQAGGARPRGAVFCGGALCTLSACCMPGSACEHTARPQGP